MFMAIDYIFQTRQLKILTLSQILWIGEEKCALC